MRKRKAEAIEEESTTPPASSQEFTSLISKYSYSAATLDNIETKPSASPVTPPETPKAKQKLKTRESPAKSRNPGYAPPSAYSHLPTPDLDSLAHNLILLFIGLNPGISFEAILS
jgi:hypothetical protein